MTLSPDWLRSRTILGNSPAGILGFGDAEILLLEVNQIHLVVGDLLLVGRLKHEGDYVSPSDQTQTPL
jgi:hypothetical protein